MSISQPTTATEMSTAELILEPPEAPSTPEATGLSFDQLTQLVLKVLYFSEATGTEIADRLHISYAVFDGFVQHARTERLVEVRGASGTGSAAYHYALTDLGRDRARQYLDICQYVGPAPVPLAQYVSAIWALAKARRAVDRASIEAGCSHLVISPRDVRPDRTSHQLGSVAVSVRPARQRQDRDRPRDWPRARRRSLDPARHRRRWSDHHDVRSRQSRAAVQRGRGQGPHHHATARPAMGAGAASSRHRGR